MVSPLNSLQSAVAVAERRVQQSRAQVAADEEQLDASRNELDSANEGLRETQLNSQRAQSNQSTARTIERAIETPVPSDLVTRPSYEFGATGKNLGTLIDVTA
jgi:hypothetical protein